jgi:hypothetical protein
MTSFRGFRWLMQPFSSNELGQSWALIAIFPRHYEDEGWISLLKSLDPYLKSDGAVLIYASLKLKLKN